VKTRKRLIGCLGLLLLTLLSPSAAQADFGIKNFSAEATEADGSVDFQAGSHPYQYKVTFDLNTDAEGRGEGGELRSLVVSLPHGMVGNPEAVPHCKQADFEGGTPRCPGNTQIGNAIIWFGGLRTNARPVFNLTPSLGSPATNAFSLLGFNSFQNASLRSDDDFGLNISDLTIPQLEITAVTEWIWGVPADPRHDDERVCPSETGPVEELGCESDAPVLPYLTLPTSCDGPPKATLGVESRDDLGVFHSKSVLWSDEGGTPTSLDGCNALEFDPTISSQPTTNLADSPTGLDFKLHQPQNQDPEGASTAALKDTSVTLPPGLTLNASAANGLDACSEGQIGYRPREDEIHFSKDPQSCPNAAKLGTMQVGTPLVDHKLSGAVYLAKPFANPFGSLLALYLAIEDEQTGVVTKLAGEVTPDPHTGQLIVSFTENPQLPLEDIELSFFNGPKAALKTPLACGKYTTASTLVPWSAPEGETVHPADSFQISAAAGGSGACPASEAQAPNRPAFSAGTIAPQAGAYSPFVLKVSRPDGSQRIGQVEATLPKGLTGKLAGVPYCSEADIAQAESREAPNQGILEQEHPSCPAASEVGTATVGAGAGIAPFYATGHAYLAGPYKGAPLSLVIVTPAVAGPFDLGAVVVRNALYVDPETAQIHAVSDRIPSIIQGVPLDIRSIAISLSRSQFTLNPTSCNPTQVLGASTSILGQGAALSNPFQVGGCRALKFAPKVAINLKGGTRRGAHPALKAVVSYPKGNYANIASAQVSLPHSEFLDQSHIGTICTKVQFAANACPKRSIYGFARAYTPLLEKPVEGPVYLRSSSHKLPDLVAALSGQVDVVLAGRVDTGKNKGIRTTFEAAPDAPVSKFVLEMQGGAKGLLINSENICRGEQLASSRLVGQNGKLSETRPLVKNSCKKARKAGKGRGGQR